MVRRFEVGSFSVDFQETPDFVGGRPGAVSPCGFDAGV
jgi:hypothetical protein